MLQNRGDKNILENYEECMKQFPLPDSMAEGWEVQECLKDGEDAWTVLVREQASGTVLVLKWGRGLNGKLLVRENEVLKVLNTERIPGVPRAYGLFEEAESVYFLREYIPGKSLYELAEDGVGSKGAETSGKKCVISGFTEAEIREIGRKICRIASKMHSLPVPMVHRDIKPENVVIDPEGNVFLVDFGTARSVKPGSRSDTIVLGSQGTAAPEQYGCAQTDRRTDVYAVGRTLLYLAVQSYEESQLADSGLSRSLQRVIRKACAFEPGRRYQTMEELEKALGRTCFSRKLLYVAAACTAFLLAGILSGVKWGQRDGARGVSEVQTGDVTAEAEQTGSSRTAETEQTGTVQTTEAEQAGSMSSAEAVVFQEPLIEAAVRQELGLDEGTAITAEMLDEVRQIRIWGTEILEPADQMYDLGTCVLGRDSSYGSERGTVSDLSDLKKMKNLEEVVLSNQQIEDLTPLKGLNIRALYLMDNMIKDMSALTELPELETLCIAGNPASDLSCLAECSNLKELNLVSIQVTDLDFIRELSLSGLNLADCHMETEENYEVLLTQTSLETLYLSDFDAAKAEAVSQMKWLSSLQLWGTSSLEDLSTLQNLKKLNSLRLSPGFRSLKGLESLNSLYKLVLIGCTELTEVSELEQAKSVSSLDIRNCGMTDFSVLEQMPGLENLCCTAEQQEEVLALNPSPDFVISCG